MNYAEQRNNPTRHLVGLTVVVLFHILLIWALVNGLGKNIVDIIKQPLETKIIKDTKPPPPEAPPPPPPQLVAPPPPYVPPPDIQIQQPPQQSNAITAISKTPPPVAPMVPTPVPTKAPAVPDSDVSARPLPGQAALEYPADMLEEEREGRVSVACDVDASGSTSNCEVTSSSGGSSFSRAALHYAESHRYHPAMHNGVAVAARRHVFVITFKMNG